MSTSTRDVDVIVIGAGPVWENLAQYATEGSGLTAVLIEQELVGGECSYWACMPSKALLRPLQVASLAGDLPGLTPPAVDVAAVLANRDAWVSHYDDSGQVDWARSVGVEVLRGRGRLIGDRLVETSRVTRLPRPASQVAASQATTPPPTMASRGGTSTTPVASRDPQGSAAAYNSGTMGSLPVAIPTACRARRRTSPTSAGTDCSSGRRRSPGKSSLGRSAGPGSMCGSGPR